MKKIFFHTNTQGPSVEIRNELEKKVKVLGFEIINDIKKADFIFAIGGDGALLSLMHEYEFPTIPIVGFNTGHLGFFQEVSPEHIDHFLSQFIDEKYSIQPYNICKCVISTETKNYTMRALNEFTIRSTNNHTIHLKIAVNKSFIENFSGDGILVATPAGSTAYNYSMGGSLVDPRLNLIQVTPIAPMNTTAYRSLTSSILLPQADNLIIKPESDNDKKLIVRYDGYEKQFDDIKKITLSLSRRKINLVRFNDYTFWDKVKEKFL